MVLNFTSCEFFFEIRLQYHQTVHIPHDYIIIAFRDDLKKWPIHEISTKERERDEALKDYHQEASWKNI